MKYLITLVSFILFGFTSQETKLEGKYRMIYEDEYTVENGTINFNEDSYTRKPENGRKVKGTIDYQKYFTYIKDEKTGLQVLISTREIGKDTIPFSTKKIDAKIPKGDIVIFTGKMIKIK